jgi:hypothetical protein
VTPPAAKPSLWDSLWVRGPVAISILVMVFSGGVQWATRDLVTTQQLTEAGARVRGEVERLNRHDVRLDGLEKLARDNATGFDAVNTRLDAIAEQRALLLRQYETNQSKLEVRVRELEEIKPIMSAVLARLTSIESLIRQQPSGGGR